jgi:hypothetical protein
MVGCGLVEVMKVNEKVNVCLCKSRVVKGQFL